ncbi:hypothetical protein GAO09_08520 [Rhizobiales bacterium RZME27]|uniref:Uncharacterized protein n=1 Tax=Endobacterium cereale TaxID=2663029 RepID=A0A6A8A877_9HYPH|nr:hypothetical protein [Endobacterium cereale]MEB2848231.1 hypothetical protein [Endobacterium cereale]MQY46098.1 hypothetical protein [Endobacterium cereale]
MSYLDNIYGFRVTDDVGYPYVRDRADAVKDFTAWILNQSSDLVAKPMLDNNLHVLVNRYEVVLCKGEYESNYIDVVLPIAPGASLRDVATSFECEPLVLVLMALIEINDRTGRSIGVEKLIDDTTTMIATNVAEKTLERLVTSAATMKKVRPFAANDNAD